MNTASSSLDALLLKNTNKKEREILEQYAGALGGPLCAHRCRHCHCRCCRQTRWFGLPRPPHSSRPVRHSKGHGEAGACVRAGCGQRQGLRARLREAHRAVPHPVGHCAQLGERRRRPAPPRLCPPGSALRVVALLSTLAQSGWVLPPLAPPPLSCDPLLAHTHTSIHTIPPRRSAPHPTPHFRSPTWSNSCRPTTCSAPWPPSA